MAEQTFYSPVINGYRTRHRIVEKAQSAASIAGNYTDLYSYFYCSAGSRYFNASTTAGVYVNGWVYEQVASRAAVPHGEILIWSGTTRVYHDADGTKSIAASSYFWTTNGGAPWSTGHLETSGTMQLTAIPRGPFVNVSGSWKRALAYVNIYGQWKPCLVYVNVSGAWKLVGG